jgi:Ca-activated chloride channel family protein
VILPVTPEAFYFLILLVPVVFILIWRFFKGARELQSLTGAWQQTKLYPVYLVKHVLTGLFFCSFIFFTVLALADLTQGSKQNTESKKGLDICFAVDVSRSMLATDIRPTRLDASISLIRSLTKNIPDARFSIIVFKGKGVITVPFTEDSTVLQNFLYYVGPGDLTAPGTNVAEGLRAASESFIKGTQKYRYVVLISDGESLEGDVLQEARNLAKEDKILITVAAGTPEGSAITLGNGKQLTDSNGKPIISKMNSSVLSSAAELTGGAAFNLKTSGVSGEIRVFLQKNIENSQNILISFTEMDKYQVFLFLGLCSLFLYLLIRVIKWKDSF